MYAPVADGVDVEVIQIGSPTCGKNTGFIPVYNCGQVYSTTTFRTENAKDFGGFENGFIPANSTVGNGEDELPGCADFQDWAHELGDQNETLIATALTFRDSGSCPIESNPSLPEGAATRAHTLNIGSAAERIYQRRPQQRQYTKPGSGKLSFE